MEATSQAQHSTLYNGEVRESEGFPGSSVVKNLPANVGDMGSVPQLGRFPGGGSGNSPQYSCLEDSTDRGASRTRVHGVAKSQT